MPFVPHTVEDAERILRRLGLDSERDLFCHIPPSVMTGGPDLPEPFDEEALNDYFASLERQNSAGLCLSGGGAYRHHIPAAVDYLSSRSEFLTAYTPYQPEMMQGSLQAIHEYQTMMASLCGLEVANASLYDGATALYEAVLMAVRVTRKWKAVVDTSVNPRYRKALSCYARNADIEVAEVPFSPDTGTTDIEALTRACDKETACVVTAQPNYFGRLSDLSGLCSYCAEKKILSVVSVNPMALALVKSPGEMGADIVCGDAQVFGMPLSWGGPYLGFLAAREKHVRRMPGRIVGATADARSRRGFVLTLQTREQHIRREKAMSNICSNQAHCALRACIYLTLAGQSGLQKTASACMHNARLLREKLLSLDGVKPLFEEDGTWFNEFAVVLPGDAAAMVRSMAGKGVAAGIPIEPEYPELGREALLLAATETTRSGQMDAFVSLLKEAATDE